MDINSQLQPIVAGMLSELKGSINAELRQQLSTEVIKTLASTEITAIVNDVVAKQVQARLDKFDFAGTSEVELRIAFKQITDQVSKNLAATTNKQINDWVSQKLAGVNIQESIASVVQHAIGENLKGTTFPESSIPHTSINFKGLKLSGDIIQGGIIQRFGSTGIDDLSTSVQMTIMDKGVAFEKSLHTPEMNVTGNLTVKGQMVILGDFDSTTNGFKQLVTETSQAVRENLNTELFDGFTSTIFNKIQTEGLDLDKISQGGKEVIKGPQLGYHIVDSNLRRLGVVEDLQTSGETLLVDTLYVQNGRVGINTMEPSHSLSIWDQEVEIVATKHTENTGFLGTARNQSLILGANNKQNIVLVPDGSVEVEQLSIGPILMTSGNKVPDYEGRAGHIVWNDTPRPGSVIGWVCIGGANWAPFGRIENS
jgi:hypothetical protein